MLDHYDHDTIDSKENLHEYISKSKQRHSPRESPQRKKKFHEKGKQPILHSQKLPAPQVASHHLSHTQASLRRIHDVQKGMNSNKKVVFPEKQKQAWIGSANEELSDDEDWIQIGK